MTNRFAARCAALVLAAGLTSGAPAGANDRSDALRRDGYQAIYSLDYDRADELFRQAIAADPNDSAAYRGAAAAVWQRALFLRGTLLVDDYMGHMGSSKAVTMPPPPPALAAAFHQNFDRAVALAEQAVGRRYNEAAPHCDLGSALGLYVSFVASIEGKTYDPGRKARRAFGEYQLAQKLDPSRKDVGLVLGTYRYYLSKLPKLIVSLSGLIGFKGGKAEGIRLLEEAAAAPSDIQTEARFALVLLYTRESRHADALAVIRGLERSFPLNRLLMLEEAYALLRNGQAAEAEAVLDAGMARLEQESRPLVPGEKGRWLYKRGSARLLTGKLDGAEEDLTLALGASDVREWVIARIHIELGKLADLRGNRAKAEGEYRAGLAIANRVRDARTAAEASRFLAQPFSR